MNTSSKIATDRAVDDPLVINADFSVDEEYLRKVDNQMRGCEQHLVDSLLSGTVCSWYRLDSGSAQGAAGDCVCLASSVLGSRTMTRATPSALAAAGVCLGVLVEPVAPGAWGRVALRGTLPASVTGLAAGSNTLIRASSGCRCERVSALTSTDYPVGAADSRGSLALAPSVPATGGGETWTQFEPFTLIDSTPHDTLIYTFPTAPAGKTYEGSAVSLFVRFRGKSIALLSGGAIAKFYSTSDYALATPSGTLPETGGITFALYTTGNTGDKAVYFRATSGGSSFNGPVAGEYLVVPTLALTDPPA